MSYQCFASAAVIVMAFSTTSSCARQAERRHVTNRFGMTFIELPAGSFKMGDAKHRDEQPEHGVTFAAAFWMQQTELTQAQWTAVMGTTPWTTFPNVRLGDDYPAVNIMWPEAQKFVQKLNAVNPGHGYRLPSEAEWEYACRAETFELPFLHHNESKLSDLAWFDANASRRARTIHIGSEASRQTVGASTICWATFGNGVRTRFLIITSGHPLKAPPGYRATSIRIPIAAEATATQSGLRAVRPARASTTRTIPTTSDCAS